MLTKANIPAAQSSFAFASGAIICLALLHLLSPEFDPSWRMVSEYALGNYSVVLSLFFISWALSNWSLCWSLWKITISKKGRVGLYCLFITGVGEMMAAFFDVGHALHELAGLLGILGLPIAAVLISPELSEFKQHPVTKKRIIFLSNLTWIAVGLLIGSLVIMYITFTKAGGKISTHITELPPGVIAFSGWANRLMIVVDNFWVFAVCWYIIHAQMNANKHEQPKVY